MTSLKNSFIKFCEKNNFEKNINQIKIIDILEKFIKPKKYFWNLFDNPNQKFCMYL